MTKRETISKISRDMRDRLSPHTCERRDSEDGDTAVFEIGRYLRYSHIVMGEVRFLDLNAGGPRVMVEVQARGGEVRKAAVDTSDPESVQRITDALQRQIFLF
jgi:hypothetical protein